MLVSHRCSFIYTKTRKTAGSSVESYFEPFCMPEGEWTQRHFREEYVSAAGIIGFRGSRTEKRKALWWNHMPARLIRRRIGDDIWNAYFKFCVIRNPFEKAISAFYFERCRADAERTGQEVLWTAHDPELFEDWLERSPVPIDRYTFCIDGRFALDDVIRHESLVPDMQRICTRLSVPWEPERLPAFKAGIRPREATARRLYTSRSRQLVRKAFRFELQYFGYKFPEEESDGSMASTASSPIPLPIAR
jgi:hypothetical protein